MGWARALTRLFTLILIFSQLSAASAQILSGRIAGTVGSNTSAAGMAAASGMPQSANDAIPGKGMNGPYFLTWKPAREGSEWISVDGTLMQRGRDYTIDYATSMIAFKTPIATGSTIKAQYEYPVGAEKNTSGMNVPLSLNIVQTDKSDVKILGLYKQGDPTSKSADTLAYGMSGSTKTSAGNLTSTLLFSPGVAGQNGSTNNASFGDSSAIKLGSSSESGNFKLSTNYSRVGRQFAAANDYQLEKGTQAMGYDAVLSAGSAIKLSSSFASNGTMLGLDKTTGDSTMTNSLLYSPNSRLSALASVQNVTTDTGISLDRSTINKLAVNAKPLDNMAIATSMTQTDSSVTGQSTGMDVNLNVTPVKDLNIKAAANSLDTEKYGKKDSQNVSVSANPMGLVNMDVAVSHSDADAAAVNAGQPGTEDTRSAKLSSNAIKNTTVSLNWKDVDSQTSGASATTDVRLETSPLKFMKFTGIYGRKEIGDVRQYIKEADLALTPFRNTNIAGDIRQSELNGMVVSRVTEVSASTKPISLIEFSGAYKTREQLDQETLDSLKLALTLNTGKLAKITGTYASNPEDLFGIVQRLESRSLGLNSDLGWLKLRGAYSEEQQYLENKLTQSADVGMDLRLSSRSALTTGYHIDQCVADSLMATSIYSLGFTHRVGSDFSLYLGGKMTTMEKDGMILPEETQYQAEAKLGLKL